MDTSFIVYSLVVAWFTFYTILMSMRIYQFKTYPHTYGQQPRLSLNDLGEMACELDEDIPAFKIIVPAYKETDVIEGTLYRLSSMNYPHTYYEVHVVTYEDEPVESGKESTTQIVKRVAAEINTEMGIELIHSTVTPAGFDGFFPGELNANERYIGKARGLNYTLRCIHEDNERDERRYFIGKMSRSGHLEQINKIIADFKSGFESKEQYASYIRHYFNPNYASYIGALSYSSQLNALVKAAQEAVKAGQLDTHSWVTMVKYIEQEASSFYLHLKQTEMVDSNYHRLQLDVLGDKAFLYTVMRSVEDQDVVELEKYSIKRDAELEHSRPILFRKLIEVKKSDEVFQLIRQFNSRWVIVYDADAEAPLDIMRHLGARIISEPDVMGFQGPIAPLLNYDSVHPMCRMGALWFAFTHSTAYPRLLKKKLWAHPLAGTNWCFRIDGFEHHDKLIRNCSYNEARRRFILSFDPRQLTEDLELGIRNYSEWSVNAVWHPVVEMEQVPPTPKAMFRQYSRWALGTLQTMRYILFESQTPIIQKFWYFMYPVFFLFACSGPVLTIGLLTAFYLGVLQVEPIFAWWTLFLAFGNVIYIWAFIASFNRYYDIYQQSSAVNFIYKNRKKLLDVLSAKDACFTSSYAVLMLNTLKQIKNGMKPKGFVSRYLLSRCLDAQADQNVDLKSKAYIDYLKSVTPESIFPEQFQDFINNFEKALAQVPITTETMANCIDLKDGGRVDQTSVDTLLDKMSILVNNATHKAGANRFIRWSKYHTQILIWSIPFILFSLGPFFHASWRWIKGEKTAWNKTTRTVKNKMHTTEN